MRVFIQESAVWNLDHTAVMLAEVVEYLEMSGHQVLTDSIGAEGSEFFSAGHRIDAQVQQILSEAAAALQRHESTGALPQHLSSQEPFKQLAQWLYDNTDLVCAWGVTSPEARALLLAAESASVSSMALERGFIPQSLLVQRRSTSSRCEKRPNLPDKSLQDRILHEARALLADPWNSKNPAMKTDVPLEEFQGKTLLFVTGHSQRNGATDWGDRDANACWQRLSDFSVGAKEPVRVIWKGHPASDFRPSPQPVLDFSEYDFASLCRKVDLVVTHNTTLWATAVLEQTPVLPLGKLFLSGNDRIVTRAASISDDIFFDQLFMISDFYQDLQRSAGLNATLEKLLVRELLETHYFWSPSGGDLSALRDLVMKEMKAPTYARAVGAEGEPSLDADDFHYLRKYITKLLGIVHEEQFARNQLHSALTRKISDTREARAEGCGFRISALLGRCTGRIKSFLSRKPDVFSNE